MIDFRPLYVLVQAANHQAATNWITVQGEGLVGHAMTRFRQMNRPGTIIGAKAAIALNHPPGYDELYEYRLIEPFWYQLTAEWLALQDPMQPLFLPDRVILQRASVRHLQYTGIRIPVI